MPLPINDLKRHNASIASEIKMAVNRVIDSGWYILGPETEQFEYEYAAFIGTKHCIGVGNGTDALDLALRALNIGPGDRVATVANAGMYGTTAIYAVGARPLYIEIDPLTKNMDPQCLRTALERDVKAIIVTHLYGQVAMMPFFIEICKETGIPIIEDCAQAHGADINGKRAGSWGDIGCFSFYPTKNLGAIGDGGAITTNGDELASKVRRLRQYGWGQKYICEKENGKNSRLDELQAAVLRVKLRYLESWNSKRLMIARHYSEGLAQLPLTVPANFNNGYVAHLYVIKYRERDALRQFLASRQINCDIHYPLPDYKQPFHREAYSTTVLHFTEECCNEVLTLPCFPEMTEHEAGEVIAMVNLFFHA